MSALTSRPSPLEGSGIASQLALLCGQICRGNPQVQVAMVVDGQGHVRASDDKDPVLLATAVAMVVPLRAFLDRATTELGCGMLRHSLIEGATATLALADVDGEHTAVLLGQPGCAPGALRADVLWLAKQIKSGWTS